MKDSHLFALVVVKTQNLMISRHRFSVTQMTAKCELKCVCDFVVAVAVVTLRYRRHVGGRKQKISHLPHFGRPPGIVRCSMIVICASTDCLQTIYSGLAASLKRKVKYTTYHASYIVNFVPCKTNKGRVHGILGHFCVPRNGPLEILFDHSDMRPRYNHADRIQIAI